MPNMNMESNETLRVEFADVAAQEKPPLSDTFAKERTKRNIFPTGRLIPCGEMPGGKAL